MSCSLLAVVHDDLRYLRTRRMILRCQDVVPHAADDLAVRRPGHGVHGPVRDGVLIRERRVLRRVRSGRIHLTILCVTTNEALANNPYIYILSN